MYTMLNKLLYKNTSNCKKITLKGRELFERVGGLHKYMNWPRGLLTDSGGFQMVSLLKLSEMSEEGVKFYSPHDNSPMLLTPEKSIQMQNAIGADIIMQLDDVVAPTESNERLEEAMWRSIRWLDRCIKVSFLLKYIYDLC